jgi:hypothetical protein
MFRFLLSKFLDIRAPLVEATAESSNTSAANMGGHLLTTGAITPSGFLLTSVAVTDQICSASTGWKPQHDRPRSLGPLPADRMRKTLSGGVGFAAAMVHCTLLPMGVLMYTGLHTAFLSQGSLSRMGQNG